MMFSVVVLFVVLLVAVLFVTILLVFNHGIYFFKYRLLFVSSNRAITPGKNWEFKFGVIFSHPLPLSTSEKPLPLIG